MSKHLKKEENINQSREIIEDLFDRQIMKIKSINDDTSYIDKASILVEVSNIVMTYGMVYFELCKLASGQKMMDYDGYFKGLNESVVYYFGGVEEIIDKKEVPQEVIENIKKQGGIFRENKE